MRKADRHLHILTRLRQGEILRAEDLAQELHTSPRTLYRDMAELTSAGLPIKGTAGFGYSLAQDLVTLPPLNLDLRELEALHIGIAILAEADDSELRAAAIRLSRKIDAALPEADTDEGQLWALAAHPVSGAEQSFALLTPLRSAIRKRQKIALRLKDNPVEQVLRPYQVNYLGRLWSLEAYNESLSKEQHIRLDAIAQIRLLPELFPPRP